MTTYLVHPTQSAGLQMETNRWVYRFDEVERAEAAVGGEWERVRALLGGKGANLAEMTRLNVPVPPGFIVTTEACMWYLQHDETFPEELWDQVLDALTMVEASMGRTFGDPNNPLLVSSRSGAKFSMPGMMDTVLNIGLNDRTVEGMAALSGDARFAYDLYRRLLQMYGHVVLDIDDEDFETIITAARTHAGVTYDHELSADDWKAVVDAFKTIIRRETGRDFPQDPFEQLRLAIEAVFGSWYGKRAVDYRNAAGISHDLGTAVNIQAMVFGNMGESSGTGVLFTRNPATGADELYGDYLTNAQGEDVVAGIRLVKPIATLAEEMPDAYEELADIAKALERHFREVQDMEFTIEQGKLWVLQTRNGKRTARAAITWAVDFVEEGLISQKEAVQRVSPEQVEIFLHPYFDPEARKKAVEGGRRIASGVNASPGAAVGVAVFDADTAEAWGRTGKSVIMVRPETKPDDVHGMLASKGILTSRGGNSSHAAIVARQFGVPAVVGCGELTINTQDGTMEADGTIIYQGEEISIDGSIGEVFVGQLPTVMPELDDPRLMTLLSWADEYRTLGVRANADYPDDARRARAFGAEGIGLCRTEHMFFEEERLPVVQEMILAETDEERQAALDQLLPMQREDFKGLFHAMDGQPVIIRLIDPPLHEFLPSEGDLLASITTGLIKDGDPALLAREEKLLRAVKKMHEANPMLGLRGVRLGIEVKGVMEMQVRAIFEAAAECTQEGVDVKLEVMIPLVSHVNELRLEREGLERIATEVLAQYDITLEYMFGTMIELPRATITADQLAEEAEFFSYGTNDLTQTTFGISRDDAEAGFLMDYVERGVLPENPFQTIDREGVGELMRIGVEKGRRTRPGMEIGICGEHGGDPNSIEFCHELGLTYVSCSPFRVPVARLAAAHAALKDDA